MKFWKSLSNLIEETLPDWRDKFLSYKDLKQQLNLIYPKELDRPIKRPRLAGGEVDGRDDDEEAVVKEVTDFVQLLEKDDDEVAVAKEVTDFVHLLEKEIEKFNGFFEDKEEEYVIRLKFLQERVAKANDSNEELMKVGREIVDFHGEMVLLENYSALNYTGLVKILKKYDKLSGALIRFPFIQKVLKQSFFETDVLDDLVKECENILDRLFSMKDQSAPSVASVGKEGCGIKSSPLNNEKSLRVPEELAEIENMENMYVKLTLSALRVLTEIRSGSSTVSMFSLPPLQNSELEEIWKKTTVWEQVAK